jgi:hypothetical protein
VTASRASQLAVRDELNCLLLLLLLLQSFPFPAGKGVMKSDGKPRFHKDGKVRAPLHTH